MWTIFWKQFRVYGWSKKNFSSRQRDSTDLKAFYRRVIVIWVRFDRSVEICKFNYAVRLSLSLRQNRSCQSGPAIKRIAGRLARRCPSSSTRPKTGHKFRSAETHSLTISAFCCISEMYFLSIPPFIRRRHYSWARSAQVAPPGTPDCPFSPLGWYN
jgi:hypothetical protein